MALKQYEVEARLKLDEVAIGISDFEFSVPDGTLGSELTATMADDTELTGAEVINFELGIDGEFATLMDVGRILETGFRSGLAQKTVTVRGLNALADRWQLAPEQSRVFYDPEQVSIVEASEATRNDIVDEDGEPIEPVVTSVPSLDLFQILNRAYVEGCGFNQIITNIENYLIKQIIFPLTSSFHSVAQGQIGVFEPVFGADDDQKLLIVDPQGTVPPDLEVQNLPTGTYVRMERNRQSGQIVTSVLLSFRDNTISDPFGGGSVTDRIDQETQEVGTFGEPGWQRTFINRFVKVLHDDPNDPNRITREIIWKIETTVSARVGITIREVSVETQEDRYSYDWRLKLGYTKTTKVLTRLPNSPTLILRDAQTEVNEIVWTTFTSNPTELAKTWEITNTTGTVLVLENPDDPEKPVKTSLLEATRTDDFPDDAEVQLGQPIKTLIERWTEVGPDQIEVRYQSVDHLRQIQEQSRTVQHTGTVNVRVGNAERTIQMLIRDAESETEFGIRVPATLDAGDVPFETAQALAQRILDRHSALPMRVQIEYAGLDLSLRRGSLRNVTDTWGNTHLVFITGYSIRGDQLGTPSFAIRQQAQGVVLNAGV